MRRENDAEYYLNYGVLESMVLLERNPYRKTCVPRSSDDDEQRAAVVRESLRRIKRRERKERQLRRNAKWTEEIHDTD